MGRAIKTGTFNMPPVKVLPETTVAVPHVIVGDEAFPLLPNVLKPYPRPQAMIDLSKAVFNYRLSRARRVSENAFGIFSQNFRIFYTAIHLEYDVLEELVMSACILHNIILDESQSNTRERQHDINSLNPQIESNSVEIDTATAVRDKFKDYFMTTGAVEWQESSARI